MLSHLRMSRNVKKIALLAFPFSSSVRIALMYFQDFIPQVDALKYLSIFYT